MTTAGLIFAARCGPSASSSANSASADSPSRTTWWSTSEPTKAPKSRTRVKFAANTLSDRTICVSIGKLDPFSKCRTLFRNYSIITQQLSNNYSVIAQCCKIISMFHLTLTCFVKNELHERSKWRKFALTNSLLEFLGNLSVISRFHFGLSSKR